MKAFLETGVWIAGVFIVIKGIFNFLSWLFYDKDKTLRDAVQQAWDYLSKHTYFEVARAALERLYERIAGIFEKRIRFFYLFLFFLLINAASLWLGKYFFGIDPAELKALYSSLNELVPHHFKLNNIDMMGTSMRPAMVVVSVFQLTVLDLCSFLFTMGIIWLACRSRGFILFLIELITDISILGLIFVVIFSLLYYWLLIGLSVGLFGSFLYSLYAAGFICMSYAIFRYLGNPNFSKVHFQDPFMPLCDIMVLSSFAVCIMFIMLFLSPSLINGYRMVFFLSIIPFIPFLLYWPLRVFFKIRPKDKKQSVGKVVLIIAFLGLIPFCILFFILCYPFYELLSSARNSKFVLILVSSSALPTLAHLLAMAAAIIAKATPKRLQKLINYVIKAIPGNDEKVLRQFGNAFGGLGALITAIIKLI